jgi:hypothetical protein
MTMTMAAVVRNIKGDDFYDFLKAQAGIIFHVDVAIQNAIALLVFHGSFILISRSHEVSWASKKQGEQLEDCAT